MTQNSSNSGKISQSLNYSTINLQDAHGNTQSPTFNATGGITVGASHLPSNGASTAASTAANATTGGSAPPTITIDLKQQASQLSNQPGLSYLGELSKRNDTTFEQVQLASQSWDYSQSGLSQSGAIIVAIAVAAATAGAASGLAATVATSAGLTGTTATVASAALAAGMTSLASQAAVSLANNQGDLGKTLQDLGSDSAVKNTLAAMVTAGVASAYAGTFTSESFAANTAAGCAGGQISGGGCATGAAISAGMQGLNYVGDLARKEQIASSSQYPGVVDSNGQVVNNLSGPSAGINGDGVKIGGERLSVAGICAADPSMCITSSNGLPLLNNQYLNSQGQYQLPANTSAIAFIDTYISTNGISSLGGLQGSSGSAFGIPYSPGSFIDKVVESFGGGHDAGNNAVGYYDAQGNNLPKAQAPSPVWNWINVPLSAPVGLSVLNSQVPLLDPIKAGINQNKRDQKK
jgi:filamentous hemagglutinin